mmetsp:Transcript_118840/g.186478  ORF Transcript_118840/g.186478 Transcript_118840/m.186478 type:complete len:85 (+) Transcript_118840:635-889(+)
MRSKKNTLSTNPNNIRLAGSLPSSHMVIDVLARIRAMHAHGEFGTNWLWVAVQSQIGEYSRRVASMARPCARFVNSRLFDLCPH